MDRFEENVAKSFSLVKKDINKLYSMLEELRLKVNDKPKTVKKKTTRKKRKKK